MNLADKLRKVLEIKNNIKAALEEKGIEVSNDFSSFADNIANISGGGEPEIPSIPEPPVIGFPEFPKYEDVYAEALASIPEQEPWVQPEDWIDLRTVLAENVIEGYPYRIAMMVKDRTSTSFPFDYENRDTLNAKYIKTSDGTIYEGNSVFNYTTHTWAGEATNGYRWVIYYFDKESISLPGLATETVHVIFDGISVNFYSSYGYNNGSGFVVTNTTKNLNSKHLVAVESINGGNIYSYYYASRFTQYYYSCFTDSFELVYIGDGVIYEAKTSLKELFKNCYSLKYIPKLGSGFVDNYASYLFCNCRSLTHIPEIGKSFTEGQYMFKNCTSLVTIPLIDTSNCTYFNYMFEGCTSLITIPQIVTSKGTGFSGMFKNCISLITIPQIDTSKGTSLQYTFNGCTSLTTIPLIDTSAVTDFQYTFNGCTSLVTIPLIDTSKGTYFNYMFQNCSSLIAIPDIDTSSANTYDYMFSGAKSLLVIPNLNFSNYAPTYGFNGIFRDCSSIEYIPQLNLPLYTGEIKFEGCDNLKSIIGINAPLATKVALTNNKISYIGRLECPKCTDYDFPGSSLKYIEFIDTRSVTNFSYFFANHSNLRTIPEIDTSNGTTFDYMFNGCSSLTTIPLIDTSKGTSFQYMFSSTSSLTTIPLIDTSNCTNFNYMFYNASSLTTIPLIDTSNGATFRYMFNGCSSLTTIPLIDTSKGTEFYYMFYNASSLTTIPLIDTSNGTGNYGFDYMFCGCSSLKSIPKLNISKATKFNQIFSKCSSLESVPDLDFTNVVQTNYLFERCYNLKKAPSFNAPNATSFNSMLDYTSVKEIGDIIVPKANPVSFGSNFKRDYVSKIGVIDISSCTSTFTIPGNPDLIKDLKFIGTVKTGLTFSNSSTTIQVENLEIESIDYALDFKYWGYLTKQSLLNILNALVEQPEGTTKTLTLNRNYHISKLTDEEKAIAINKGWTISESNTDIN